MPREYGTPQEWMDYARADLALAAIPLPAGVRYQQLCCHAQQAAEKALKAVLIHREIEFPRTHAIAALLDMLPEDLPRTDELRRATKLTGYATFLKYPVEDATLTEERWRELVGLARAVVEWAEDATSAPPPSEQGSARSSGLD